MTCIFATSTATNVAILALLFVTSSGAIVDTAVSTTAPESERHDDAPTPVFEKFVFRASNYPTYAINAPTAGAARIITGGTQAFEMVHGLDNGITWSFRLAGTGNLYLRHRNFKFEVTRRTDDPQFIKDASFIQVAGAIPGTYSYMAANFHNYYMVHHHFKLELLQDDNSNPIFGDDRSWIKEYLQ